MASGSSSNNGSIKLRLIAWDKNSKSEVRTAGYATTLDLTLKAKKNWGSVVQHLSKKWSKVDRIGSRLQLFEMDTATQQPTVNYLTSFGSLSVGNSLGAHPALSKAGSAGSIPMIHLYYHFAIPQQSQQVFSGRNLLSNMPSSGFNDIRVSAIPKERVYGHICMGNNTFGVTESLPHEDTMDAVCDVVQVICGNDSHIPARSEPRKNRTTSKSTASLTRHGVTHSMSTLVPILPKTQYAQSSADTCTSQLSLPALRSSVNDLPLLLSSLSPPVVPTDGIQQMLHFSSTPSDCIAGGSALAASAVSSSDRDMCSLQRQPQQQEQPMGHPHNSMLVLGDETMACLADLSGQSMLSPPPRANPPSICQDMGTGIFVMDSTVQADGDAQYHHQDNTDIVGIVAENSIIHISDSIAHFLYEFGQESTETSAPKRDESDVSSSYAGVKRGVVDISSEMYPHDPAEVAGLSTKTEVTIAHDDKVVSFNQDSHLPAGAEVVKANNRWAGMGGDTNEKRRRVDEELGPVDLNVDETNTQDHVCKVTNGMAFSSPVCVWITGECGDKCVPQSSGECGFDTRERPFYKNDSESSLSSNTTPFKQSANMTMPVSGNTPPASLMAVIISESSGQGASASDSSTSRRHDQDHRLRGCDIPLAILQPNKKKPLMKRITPTFVSKLPTRPSLGKVKL